MFCGNYWNFLGWVAEANKLFACLKKYKGYQPLGGDSNPTTRTQTQHYLMINPTPYPSLPPHYLPTTEPTKNTFPFPLTLELWSCLLLSEVSM